MIFHHHRAIFFHIGKTAGSSIEQLVDDSPRDVGTANYVNFYGRDHEAQLYLQHATPAYMQLHTDKAQFDSYYKFTVIRNPFARIASAFSYNNPNQNLTTDFERFVLNLEDFRSPRDMVNGHHFLDQVSYTHLDGRLICDDVLYFEELPTCIDVIRGKLGIEKPLPHIQKPIKRSKSSRAKVSKLYSTPMIDTVLRLYHRDFEVFGYQQDPAVQTPPKPWQRRLQRYPKKQASEWQWQTQCLKT